jgi:hypothetical protein
VPRDGDIDYRSLTRTQLEDALARIDARAYPLNHANLVAELARRPAEGVPAPREIDPAAPTVPLPAWFERFVELRAVRAVTRVGVGAFFATSVAGWTVSDLIASDRLGRLAVIVALGCALLGFVVAVSKRGPLFDLDLPDVYERFRRHAWVRNDLARAVVVGLFGAVLGIGSAQGFAWSYTVAYGSPAARTFVATRNFGRADGGLRCRRPRLAGVPLPVARGLCFSRRYPRGTEIRVSGAESRFGIRAENVTIVRTR